MPATDRIARFPVGCRIPGIEPTREPLSTLLYEVAPADPATFGISLLLLIMVAGVACWIPSRGAARIDPMLALRID